MAMVANRNIDTSVYLVFLGALAKQSLPAVLHGLKLVKRYLVFI